MSWNIFLPVWIAANYSDFNISVAISNLYSWKARNSKLELEQSGTDLLRQSPVSVWTISPKDQPLVMEMGTVSKTLDGNSILTDTAHHLRRLHSISMLWKLQIIEGSTVACIRCNDRYFLGTVFWWGLSLNATCLIMQRYGCTQNSVNH